MCLSEIFIQTDGSPCLPRPLLVHTLTHCLFAEGDEAEAGSGAVDFRADGGGGRGGWSTGHGDATELELDFLMVAFSSAVNTTPPERIRQVCSCLELEDMSHVCLSNAVRPAVRGEEL